MLASVGEARKHASCKANSAAEREQGVAGAAPTWDRPLRIANGTCVVGWYGMGAIAIWRRPSSGSLPAERLCDQGTLGQDARLFNMTAGFSRWSC